MLCQVFLSLALVSSSLALLFDERIQTGTSEGRAVEESCLASVDEDGCEFYSCFERRLPCGRGGFMLRRGHYYCNKMLTLKPQFSAAGQAFLDNVVQCVKGSMRMYYDRDYVDCHDLDHAGVEAYRACFIENEFCNIYMNERDNFNQIFEFGDLFTRGAGKLWRLAIRLTAQCGQQHLARVTNEAMDEISEFFNSVRDVFD